MRRIMLAIVLVASAAVLALSVTSGAQGQGNKPGQGQSAPPAQDRTIVLYEKDEAATFRFVDAKPFTRLTRNGPKQTSAGDAFILGTPLFSDAALTQSAGRLRVHCTAMNGSKRFDRVTFLCDGAYSLRDGTMMLSGLYKPAEGAQLIKIAVVGGTDAYAGARGTVTIEDPEPGNSKDTIRLLAG